MKIIHLSDLHVGHKKCGENFRTIIDNITFLKQPAGNYVIIITGDLVDNANRGEQVSEAAASVRLLQKRGYRVLIVPGNHDYGTGSLGDAKFVPLFKKRFYGSARVTYPRLDVIENIAFIGLDSTAEELHWNDRILAEGELGEAQLSRLKKIMDKPEVISRKKVVYLHHHPFDFKFGRQLRDRDHLREILENNVDALLFGHYHREPSGAGKIFHGAWGITRCYNAGSATHKNGNIGFHRVIDLANPDPRSDYDGNFL